MQVNLELKGTEAVAPVNPFSRANILATENKIRLVDTDEETGLDLFCYNRCSNEEDDFIKQCRGLVFHGENLVMKAFSYTDEYNHTQIEILRQVLPSFSEWTFYRAYEGALLRLFYFSGKWFLTTHRKLNAFRSKWSSKDSFGTLFKRALENEAERSPEFKNSLGEGENILDRFQNSLDKSKQYMFLLRNNNDNRIVCCPPEQSEPLLFHVGTFSKDGFSSELTTGLSAPERLSFSSVEEMSRYIEEHLNPMYHQGVYCFGKNNVQVKVLHRDYQELFSARGNEPSVKFRYLQVRMNKKMTDMLYRLYPELSKTFNDYENTIYDVAQSIYRSYVQRFIKKRYVTVPKEEFQVMSEVHSWHLADRNNNRITLEKVIGVLNKQSPTNLNHMIRRFKTEQTKKQETFPRSIKGSRNNSAVNSPAIVGLTGSPKIHGLPHGLPPPQI